MRGARVFGDGEIYARREAPRAQLIFSVFVLFRKFFSVFVYSAKDFFLFLYYTYFRAPARKIHDYVTKNTQMAQITKNRECGGKNTWVSEITREFTFTFFGPENEEIDVVGAGN